MILEVVCGQRPWTKIGGFQHSVDWVWSLHGEGRVLEAVDERLGDDYDVEEAQRLFLASWVGLLSSDCSREA